MANYMRCLYCGLLQDEPTGIKQCQRCGGELTPELTLAGTIQGSYLAVQMELDQVSAPAGQTIDRHLLLTLKTPKEVPAEHAARTESGRPPLSFHAVVDVSGSMQGMKMEQTRQALRTAARLLREGDVFSISTFSTAAHVVLKPTTVDKKSIALIDSVVNEMQPGGMTALFSGLEMGIKQAYKKTLDTTLVLLLSDGQANVGEIDLEVLGQMAAHATTHGLVVSTLGVGSDYNEALITEIATQGRGRFYHIQSADQIVAYLTAELGEASDLAARNVRLCIDLPQGAALIPLSATYRSELADNQAVVSIGDIPADLEVEIPLRLTLFCGQEGARLAVNGEVRYLTPAGSELISPLNQVTVRFVMKSSFQLDMGAVPPVVERVAHQMRATQMLHYARATSRGDQGEMQAAEGERLKLRDYLNLLDQETASKFNQDMDRDVHAVRSSSPLSKQIMNDAFQVQRFMHKPGGK